MEILRTLMTLAAFTAFLAIVWWAYAPSRKQAWERKAQLLDDEQTGTDHVCFYPKDRNGGLSLISGSPSRHD